MTVAIVVFPGTNCEQDIKYALESVGTGAELVWHRETSLEGATGVVLPGGFAHGDYLRTGAIARFSPIMQAVEKFASDGGPTLGICNGFQVLCEAGLLPGALIANRDLRFICRPVFLRVESTESVLTRLAEPGQVLSVPLNSYEGNYVPGGTPSATREAGRAVLRYSDARGEVSAGSNPNGSYESVAAMSNGAGNVAGIMPHPERAIEGFMGSTDGRVLLESFVAATLDDVPTPAGAASL